MKKSNSSENLLLISFPISKYYSEIMTKKWLINDVDIFGRNVFHKIAMYNNDAEEEQKEKLISNCLNFVIEEIGGTKDLSILLNLPDLSDNTPMSYAIERNNLFFLKFIITKNITEPWEALKNNVISEELTLFLLERYFDLKLDKLILSEEAQVYLIEKMEEKHLPFVLQLFDNLEVILEEREVIIAKKVIGYNNPSLVSLLITYEIGIDYLEQAPNDVINLLTLAIKNKCDDLVIKLLLEYTEDFTLAQYNQLLTSAIELTAHWDSEGNTFFHKIASLEEKNREENFGQLMYNTLNMMLVYLDNNEIIEQNNIKYKPLVFYIGTLNQTALELAFKFDQIDFVSALANLNVLEDEIFSGLRHANSQKMKSLIYEYKLSQAGTSLEQLQNIETKYQAASILIETTNKKSLALTIKLFEKYNVLLDFQSFSHKLERKTSAASNTLLHKAVLWCDFDSVVKLLDKNVNYDLQNKEGLTPIAIAASMNNNKIIDALLDKKANVNLCSMKGTVPLHYVVINLNYECVVKLIFGQFLDVNVKDFNGNTPMHFALTSQLNTSSSCITKIPTILQHKIISFLVEAKADINLANKNGDTSMHLAVVGGDVSFMRLLYKLGAKFDVANKDDFKPLDLVTKQTDELVEFLIDLGIESVCKYYSKNKIISNIIDSIKQADFIFKEKNLCTDILIKDSNVVYIRLKHLFKSIDFDKEVIEKLYHYLKLIKFDKELITMLFDDYSFIEDSSSEEAVYSSFIELEFKKEWHDDVLESIDKQLKEELEEYEEVLFGNGAKEEN